MAGSLDPASHRGVFEAVRQRLALVYTIAVVIFFFCIVKLYMFVFYIIYEYHGIVVGSFAPVVARM